MDKKEIFKRSCKSCAGFCITSEILNNTREDVAEESFAGEQTLAKRLRYYAAGMDWAGTLSQAAAEAIGTLLSMKWDNENYYLTLAKLESLFIMDAIEEEDAGLHLCLYLYILAQKNISVMYNRNLNSGLKFWDQLRSTYAEAEDITVESLLKLARETFTLYKHEADGTTHEISMAKEQVQEVPKSLQFIDSIHEGHDMYFDRPARTSTVTLTRVDRDRIQNDQILDSLAHLFEPQLQAYGLKQVLITIESAIRTMPDATLKSNFLQLLNTYMEDR